MLCVFFARISVPNNVIHVISPGYATGFRCGTTVVVVGGALPCSIVHLKPVGGVRLHRVACSRGVLVWKYCE